MEDLAPIAVKFPNNNTEATATNIQAALPFVHAIYAYYADDYKHYGYSQDAKRDAAYLLKKFAVFDSKDNRCMGKWRVESL